MNLVFWTSWWLLVCGLHECRGVQRCWRGAGGAGGAVRDGVLGSVPAFPWLGVLRVHLHEESGLKIALTGIVLVREHYALGSAGDVARIPRRVFLEDSRAMFIPAQQQPWFCRLRDYLPHPEYPDHSATSVALIELDVNNINDLPVVAACWPPAGYNLTGDLYAVGYTDENEVLEKFSYQLQYVEPEPCREFYDRAQLMPSSVERAPLVCGHAARNTRHCVWDNGIALATNHTGHWMLLGLGLHGPGCAAPARFLSLAEYWPWLSTVTEGSRPADTRRAAFHTGFRVRGPLRYVPAHALLGSGGRRQGKHPPLHTKHDFAHYYPYESIIDDPFYVARINATTIHILPAIGANATTTEVSSRKIRLPYPTEMLPRLPALDQFLSSTPEMGPKIHSDLALEWTDILHRGLGPGDRETILEEYLIPYNCKLLVAPRLNGEVSGRLPALVRRRDLTLARQQQQLGAGLAAAGRALSDLMRRESINRARQHLARAARLLADLHQQWTRLRLRLMQPSMDRLEFSIIYQEERSDRLFGDVARKVYAKASLVAVAVTPGSVDLVISPKVSVLKWGHYAARAGNCSLGGLAQVYRDRTDITLHPRASNQKGRARFHFSVMDTEFANYTCITLRLRSLTGYNAYLQYSAMTDDGTMFPETPSEVVRVYPLFQLSRLWERGERGHLQPDPVRGGGRNISAYTLHLHLEASFEGAAQLEVAVYGVRGEHPVTRYPPNTTTTSTTPAGPTTDPYASLRLRAAPAEAAVAVEEISGASLTAGGLVGAVILASILIIASFNDSL